MGHVSFEDQTGDGSQFHILGDIICNEDVFLRTDASDIQYIRTDTAASLFGTWQGEVFPNLEGTVEEIPNLTNVRRYPTSQT